MAKISLQSIKRENAHAVLEAIARKRHITKLEISEETGLSLMTVGKIVSILGAGGIIVHGKNIAQKVGRRAEVLRIRHDWLIPYFEISSRIFKFYITNLEGEILDKVEYRCAQEPLYFANEYVYFLKKTLALLRKNYKNKKAIGVGVSVAGVYDAETDTIHSSMLPEMDSLKLMQNISKIFSQKNVVVDNANRLCAAGIIEKLPEYKNRCVSCLTIGDTIECSTMDHGHWLCGSGNLAGRLGDLPYALGVTYANYLRNAQNTTDVTEPALDLLRAVSVAYDPDTIYLCSSKFTFPPAVMDRLRSSLHCSMIWPHKSPDVIYVRSTELESMSGIISRIIGNWLDSLLEKSEDTVTDLEEVEPITDEE